VLIRPIGMRVRSMYFGPGCVGSQKDSALSTLRLIYKCSGRLNTHFARRNTSNDLNGWFRRTATGRSKGDTLIIENCQDIISERLLSHERSAYRSFIISEYQVAYVFDITTLSILRALPSMVYSSLDKIDTDIISYAFRIRNVGVVI
jgi:hypothetical protein